MNGSPPLLIRGKTLSVGKGNAAQKISGASEEMRWKRSVTRARGSRFHNSSCRVTQAKRGCRNSCR